MAYLPSEQVKDIQLTTKATDSSLLAHHFERENALQAVMQIKLHSTVNPDSMCKALDVDGHYCQVAN
ncbi:hypothetical protein BS049_RS23355 [Vibrio parahaemolyticus]|nr:hypothetical protein [Vibrio parahaemolyticus]